MAGEVEDCWSLQADCLPTGSVSFGRFDYESLSWQRRSSFGYDRYHDDVEKYSTRGLVTQKKAYFEAEFKRRTLLRQASSDQRSNLEHQDAGNGSEDQAHYLSKSLDRNSGKHFDFLDKILVEKGNATWCHERPTLLNGHQNIKLEPKLEEASSSEDSVDAKTSGDDKQVSTSKLHHKESTRTPVSRNVMHPNKKCPDRVAEQNPKNRSDKKEKVLGKRNSSLKSPISGKDNLQVQKRTHRTASKVKATVEEKYRKPKAALPKVARSANEKEAIASNIVSPRTFRKTELENPLPKKTEKPSSLRVPSSTYSKPVALKADIKDTGKPKANSREDTHRSGRTSCSAKTDAQQNGCTSFHTTPENRKEGVVPRSKSPKPQSKSASPVSVTTHQGNTPGPARVHPSSRPTNPSRGLYRTVACDDHHTSALNRSIKAEKTVNLKGMIQTSFSQMKIDIAKKELRSNLVAKLQHGKNASKKAEMVGAVRSVIAGGYKAVGVTS